MWLLRATTSLRPPVHPNVHIPAWPTLHILGARAKAAQDTGAERGRRWHHSPPPQGRDDPDQPQPCPPHLLPILAASAGPGSPGRTVPSHAGLQGGTGSFVYLTASLTNKQSLSPGLPQSRPQSNITGKCRGAPRRTQSMSLFAHACMCVHACACMHVRAGSPDKRATGPAAALGSELPRRTQVKQALRSILLTVPLVPPFVLVHITAWLPRVPVHRAHPHTPCTAAAFPTVPAGRMGTTVGSPVSAWAGSSVMPRSLPGRMSGAGMCGQAMPRICPEHREPGWRPHAAPEGPAALQGTSRARRTRPSVPSVPSMAGTGRGAGRGRAGPPGTSLPGAGA